MGRFLLVGALAAVALSAFGVADSARSGQARWVVTDLGKDCSPDAINERGEIVGRCWSAKTHKSDAVLWQNGKVTRLGRLAGLEIEPFAINERGQIVGQAVRYGSLGTSDRPVESFGFLWQNGRMTKLGRLGGELSVATAVNDRGQILGYSETKKGDHHVHAVLWEPGRMTDLGPWAPRGINNLGQVIGEDSSGGRSRIAHGLLWANGKTRDLGTLIPAAINDRGQIVGRRDTKTGIGHAILWEQGRMTDLGTLPGSHTQARAISVHGQIAGDSFAPGRGDHVVLTWENGRMTNLGSFGGSPILGAPKNVLGTPLHAINDRGEVIVTSFEKASKSHAFVWDNGRTTALGTRGGTSEAIAINNHGQIIGWNTTESGEHHGVRWTRRPSR